MDRFGLQIDRNHVGDARLVPCGPVRQCGAAGIGAGDWQILMLEEVSEAFHRRIELACDRGPAGGIQGGLVRWRETAREILDRRLIDAVLDAGSNELRELRQHGIHDCLRQHDALLHSFAHVRNSLVDSPSKLIQAGQISPIIFDAMQRLRAFAGRNIGHGDRDAFHAVQRQQVLGKGGQAKLQRVCRGGRCASSIVVSGGAPVRAQL